MRKRIKQPSVLSRVERINGPALTLALLLATATHVQWITPQPSCGDNCPAPGSCFSASTICSPTPPNARATSVEDPAKGQSREELRRMWARSIQCLAYPPVLSFFHPRAKPGSTLIHDIEQIAIMEVTR